MFKAEKSSGKVNPKDKKLFCFLLAVRFVCVTVMVLLLAMQMRSVRLLRWERSVSGRLLVIYMLAVVGLAVCAGIEGCGAKVLQLGVRSIYGMRLLVVSAFVILMRVHFRSQRMFHWDQAYSGITLAMNVAGIIGLSIFVGMKQYGYNNVKAYLSGVSGVVLAANAFSIWRRWRRASNMTRVVADLLGALALPPLHRQVFIKVCLSVFAAVLMLIDFTCNYI